MGWKVNFLDLDLPTYQYEPQTGPRTLSKVRCGWSWWWLWSRGNLEFEFSPNLGLT